VGDEKRYQTDRTRELRLRALNDYEKDLLGKVEKFGHMVLHVKDPHEPRPSFSYTIGCANTRNTPEFITCGLTSDAAQGALNYAVDLASSGIDLTQGRHPEFLENVDVEFRLVDPKWVRGFMNSTVWYHGHAEFPVLQLVYPDREGRFPGEKDFNSYFDQPMLQPGAPMRGIEQEFWDTNSPDGKFRDWKFPCSPHTSAYVSQNVHDGTESITYVSHDADDGAWQFLGDSMSDGGGPVLVCLHHPIDKDPSLKELADLPPGWCAVREAPGKPWMRSETPPDEDDDEDEETA
jgi:hypothetical protein